MSVRRIYVEKLPEYAVAAKELFHEIKGYLGITTVTGVRVLVRYDIENLSEETYKKAVVTVFSEPPVDTYSEGTFKKNDSDRVFSVEALPGQFDQRADSAEQCLKLLKETEEPVVRCATTYILEGRLTDEEFERVKKHCINPVDSRETGDDSIPETLIQTFEEPEDVKTLTGFADMAKEPLKKLYDSFGLAMTFNDFLHIQNYFKNDEHRDPTMTEIRVLDTYWSDHCRHTTFNTELKKVSCDEGYYKKPIMETYEKYVGDRNSVYAGRPDKFVCLMEMALMGAKKLKAMGKLQDQEESDEINACSIVVPVEIDGKEEEWLVNFKNETHNHPTEIEPFGGAATCLGGAIRDPLSGRTYVYQAMRITGAADPTVSVKDTLPNKLPQKKIVRSAAAGYSSYGNQIGLSTGYVKEIYHPNYVAKRMEIGAVMGAAPRKAVQRLTSDPGDIIILLGGRTGRDGCGGATGSSKAHNSQSLTSCGAEVQKGNAPTERKLQRLFRRPEVSHIIKKCNDFGAGGVSVAIGELADGLTVNLDLVPKKYAGLDGTEIAISESQERMAVVVAPEDKELFLKYAASENLEATPVAVVTAEPRLVLNWRGKTIVNLKRSFLDTNGAHQETDVCVSMPSKEDSYFAAKEIGDVKEYWLNMLGDLNVCSQKGLVERFDGSIGAGSVYMPYGGKYQLTETQSMVAKLPVLNGKCDTVTMMSYGYDPYLSSWSPYHGAVYAITDSIAKIVASGGDHTKIRMTYQEYFKRMTADPYGWGEPFCALLGAYDAQMGFELPSIGGKDSMSGSFNDIHVPPTLCSFAVDIAKEENIITPEFKKAGNKLVKVSIVRDEYDLPVFAKVNEIYSAVAKLISEGKAVSAWALGANGIAEAVSKMAFGNGLGAKVDDKAVSKSELFAVSYGDILLEVPADAVSDWEKTGFAKLVGEVADADLTYGNVKIALSDALDKWKAPLERVFPTDSHAAQKAYDAPLYNADSIYVCKNKVAKPRVFIPVFPGTNCEYDSAKAFERAGADVTIKVLKNLSAQDIRESVDEFVSAIKQSQIIMFPGGFSAGDEPEGSAKFFATAFRNEKLKEAVDDLLGNRDGLALGICNGFQALIKLGLVPYGKITAQKTDSPTLTYNTIGRHISKMVYLKVVSNKSPWLAGAKLGGVYVNPASHGEGRFVANDEWIKKLFANGQVATRYVDINGNVVMDEEWNVNGSFAAIEGITSEDGRVFGKMAHSERRGESVAINIYGEQDMKIFESGVNYFK